jgi:pilus assembly protein CpaF
VSGRQLSPATPLVTAKLDRARVNFADGVVVPDLGLAISIRKFNPQLSMEGLLRMGALTPGMRDIIWAVVRARGTVLVSGATGVGKTTLLSAAAEAIPYNDRIITIEDAREIALGDRLSWVPMQTKEKASGDDTALIDQAELLKNSLRQRPDRLVIGEVRDGRTASVMLEAANTGHEGTMTTLHANSASDALNSRIVRAVRRYEDSPPEVVREEVAEAFDLVVHGLRRRGRRFVAEICEVSPAYMVDGRIEPRVLWRAHIDVDREVHFEHVNGLDPDGRIALRLSELGVDPSQFDPVAD